MKSDIAQCLCDTCREQRLLMQDFTDLMVAEIKKK